MEEKKIHAAQALIVAVILLAVMLASWWGGGAERTEDTARYAVSSDLNGQPLAVVTGSEYADFTRKLFPASKLVYVTSWADVALAVSQGKAEGLLMESLVTNIILNEYPDLAVLPDVIMEMEYSFLTPRDAAGVAQAREFDAFLAEYHASGAYDALHEKWMAWQSGTPPLEPCASDGSKGVLRVGTSNDWEPYCYVANGETVGLFLDITYRFCEWAGYTPDVEVVAFDSGFMGIRGGKYDLLAYGYVNAPERAEEVTFTAPLEGDDLMMIVRKGTVVAGDDTPETAGEPLIAAPEESFLAGLESSFEKNFIRENRWKMMLSGLGVTLGLALCAAVLGTLLGALICLLRRRNNPFALGFARMYVKFFQGMPIVVLLLVLYYVIFAQSSISAFIVCALGFSLDFSAYTSEIFRTGIEAVPPGQQRAALALGFSKGAAFRNVVLPQALRHILPVYRGQFVSMVKTTAVAGYISVQDLTKVSDIIRSRTYDALFPLLTTAVIYFLLAALLVSALRLIETRTDPLRRRREPKGVKL